MRKRNYRNPKDPKVAIQDELDKWVKAFKEMSEFDQVATLQSMIESPDTSGFNRKERVDIYRKVVKQQLDEQMVKHLKELNHKRKEALDNANKAGKQESLSKGLET